MASKAAPLASIAACSAAVLGMGLCATAHAGESPVALQSVPDFSGDYAIQRLRPPEEGQSAAAVDPDFTGFVEINPELDVMVMRRMQPWAIAKMLGTNTRADDMGAVCRHAGIFRHPSSVYGFRWLNKPDQYVVISEAFSQVGVRRFDLVDKHPENLPLTFNGNSIAHWEGNTLVVDTTGFNDRTWLTSAMAPHTSELVVQERIRLVAKGKLLEILTTVDDRQALAEPYTYSRYYRKLTEPKEESVCNGEPGEPQRWEKMRQNAKKKQMQDRKKLALDPDAPPPAPPAVG